MDEIEKNLAENIKEYVNSGDEEIEKQRYNIATTLYFKAIAILCDLKIYEKVRMLPKNHSERFLFLKMHFKEAYELINPLFNKYTDSYSLRLNKSDALTCQKPWVKDPWHANAMMVFEHCQNSTSNSNHPSQTSEILKFKENVEKLKRIFKFA